MRDDVPKISPLIEQWMPDASTEDKERSTENFRNYLAVVYKLFEQEERKK